MPKEAYITQHYDDKYAVVIHKVNEVLVSVAIYGLGENTDDVHIRGDVIGSVNLGERNVNSIIDGEVKGAGVLLRLTNKSYIYVGKHIIQFSLEQGDDKLFYFTNAMGNNNHPYPWARDNSYIYFLLDGVHRVKDNKYEHFQPWNHHAYSIYFNEDIKKDKIDYKVIHSNQDLSLN